MESALPAIAGWLGSHAIAFFAIATALVLAVLLLAWHAIVRHAPNWARRFFVAFAKIEPWMPALASRGVKRAWTRVAAYFTVYVVIAFAVALAGITLFVELADEIETGEDVAVFDEAFTAALRESTPRWTLVLFHWATRLGDPPFLTVVSTLMALWLLGRRQRVLLVVWIAATAGNGLLTRTLKAIFERTRPVHDHGLMATEGWSFPSGHASGSLAVYTMLVYLILRGRDIRWWHVPLLAVAMVFVLVIGFSRVFLQVHYLSDVIAGYMVAASWLAICIAGAEMARAWHGRHWPSRPPSG